LSTRLLNLKYTGQPKEKSTFITKNFKRVFKKFTKQKTLLTYFDHERQLIAKQSTKLLKFSKKKQINFLEIILKNSDSCTIFLLSQIFCRNLSKDVKIYDQRIAVQWALL